MWGFLLKRFDSAQALLPDWWACMRAIADLGKGRNCDRLVDIIAPFLESFVARASSAGYMGFVCALVELRS